MSRVRAVVCCEFSLNPSNTIEGLKLYERVKKVLLPTHVLQVKQSTYRKEMFPLKYNFKLE
jgi:hypothetical protein